ncbi:MAG TPA: hypothetical protein VHK00_02675 [Miltoncostaeaceae bacterium]|nr:hypothetical protein [Miltoncostaeaceae bacterium]
MTPVPASPAPQRRLAILAYGSLLYHLGPGLAPVVVGSEPCRTPFPVEYGRASRRWGGGPVLVPHPRGGSVQGALLHLADGVEAAAAARLLAEREGLDGTRGIVQVDLGGDRLVLSASLPRNLTERDMVPTALARRAVESASHGPRNGVAYLRGAVGAGVRTPLTDAYAASVLELVGASSLADAERLVALERPAAAGGANGLG